MATEEARSTAAAALRALGHAFAARDPDDDVLTDIAQQATELARRVGDASLRDRMALMRNRPDGSIMGGRGFEDRAVGGSSNPTSVELEVRYEDDEVVVFRNRLNWVPVMLLAVPRQHMHQGELWTSDVMAKVSSVAAEIGAKFCPNGFRILSNFGYDAMQSQAHGHVHILGGTYLGEYA